MNDHNADIDRSGETTTGNVHEIDFDLKRDSVSTELIRTIASIERVDPTELEPLANVVDPEALEVLFSPLSTTSNQSGGAEVRFTYANYFVRIKSDGTMRIHSAGERD